MPMKYSWFHHLECTTQQADELVARYRQRGVKVERSLNPDFMTWTVSAQLVEDKSAAARLSLAQQDVGVIWRTFAKRREAANVQCGSPVTATATRKPACWRITAVRAAQDASLTILRRRSPATGAMT
jgi:hypothetical protein